MKQNDNPTPAKMPSDSLPLPISRSMMKPVVYKGNQQNTNDDKEVSLPWIGVTKTNITEVSVPWIAVNTKKNDKENILVRPPQSNASSVKSSVIEKLDNAKDSELWTDDDEDGTEYRTPIIAVRAPKISLKSVVKKLALAVPLKPQETNPFKVIQKQEEEKGKMPTTTKPSSPTETNRNLFTRKQVPSKVEEVRKPKKKLTVGNDAKLENYHTVPFNISETRSREIRSQLFFQVELVEIATPSQFMFKINEEILQNLMVEMR